MFTKITTTNQGEIEFKFKW